MPAHDWARVDAGIFHSFHLAWLSHLSETLNGGLLPDGFYALTEQHAGRRIPDILTLHASPAPVEQLPFLHTGGGTAVAEAPPRMRRHESVEAKGRRRTVAIRHVSGHRLIALFELVSPGNKDREESVDVFVSKAVAALESGVHVGVVDLFPPGSFDRHGMTGAIRARLTGFDDESDSRSDCEPLTLASYVAGPAVEVYFDYLSVGDMLPEMPLFLNPERYVSLPLESSYCAAYQGMPAFWRNVLEGKEPEAK